MEKSNSIIDILRGLEGKTIKDANLSLIGDTECLKIEFTDGDDIVVKGNFTSENINELIIK